MAYKPLWDYVLIDVDEIKKQTDSGFFIPSSSKEVPPIGTVVAIGPDCKAIKVGDKVIFARMAARYLSEDITDDSTGERLVHEKDIWAKVTNARS